jgi:hypothetical protein
VSLSESRRSKTRLRAQLHTSAHKFGPAESASGHIWLFLTPFYAFPDGAPAKAAAPGTPLPAPEDDRKYEYLWNCREYLDKASKFLLATDSDDPGQALAEELARRLGREKCWRVKWPITATGQVKDANEALTRVGKSGLREAVEGAEAFPIRGLFKFESFFDEIDDYYNLQLGDERGVSTGEQMLFSYLFFSIQSVSSSQVPCWFLWHF